MNRLANLIAVREPDSHRAADASMRLVRAGWAVGRLGPWVVGTRPICGRPLAFAPETGLYVAEAPDAAASSVGTWQRAAESPTTALALEGDNTFIRICQDGGLRAVTAVAGSAPLYYAVQSDRAAVSTTVDALCEHFLVTPRPDLEALAVYLCLSVWLGDRTFISDVRVAPPGHLLTIASTARLEPYWGPELFAPGASTRRGFHEAARAVRGALTAELSESLSEEGNLLTLSGGVDSSIVASLAGGVLRRPVHTVTMAGNWGPDDTRQKYLRSVWDFVGDSLVRADTLSIRVEDRLNRLNPAKPIPFPFVHPVLCALDSIEAEGCCRAYAGGEFADQLFGAVTVSDVWMTQRSLGAYLSRPELLPMVVRRSRGLVMHHWQQRRGNIPIHAPTLLVEALRPELARAVKSYRADWQLRLRTALTGRLPWRLAQAHAIKAEYWERLTPRGIAPRFPFLNRRMLQTVLSTAPHHHLSGTGKPVLREAVRGLVPELNRLRPDKGLGVGAPRQSRVHLRKPVPDSLAGLIHTDWLGNAPGSVPTYVALQLAAASNMLAALCIGTT